MIAIRKNAPFLLLALSLAVLAAGCAHKRAYKRALRHESSGQFLQAAEEDLSALDRKPEYEPARNHLQSVAPSAWEEVMGTASSQEAENRWLDAVDTYETAERFLARLTRHDISITVGDVPTLRERARTNGRQYHFGRGNRFFDQEDWESAVAEYLKVVALVGYFDDTKEKLWEAHVHLGDRARDAGYYERAITDYYRPALRYAEATVTENATRTFIADTYYRWAVELETQGDNRGAYEKYGLALETVPEFRDAEARRDAAYEAAVSRVAVLPFRNASSYGLQYAGALTEHLTNACVQAELEFAVFATRAHLEEVLQEHALAASGAIDSDTATRIGQLEGIDFFITGAVTQISEQTSSPTFQERTHTTTRTVRDSTGKEVKVPHEIFYREYTARRTVEVSASYQIVEVESGRIIEGDDFTQTVTDETQWIRYQGSIYDLPENKRVLLDASGEPKSADMLTNDAIRLIATEMSRRIVRHFR